MWDFISVRRLEKMIAEGKPMMLIDLRSRQDYIADHIPQAVSRPLDGTWTAEETRRQLSQIKAELVENSCLPCILICRRGSNSIRAAQSLDDGKHCIYTVCGGMDSWNHRKGH